MTFASYIAQAQVRLKSNQFDPAVIFSMIYEFHPSVKSLIELSDYLQDEIIVSVKTKIDCALDEMILLHKPLAYILGYTWFLGAKFTVNNGVLIPRIETEYWLDKLIEILDDYAPLNVLDLCCGSGVIGLSIKRQLSRMKVSLSDISDDAIQNTLVNAKNLQLDVEVIKSDLFDNLTNWKFDVIVCNPPYIDPIEQLDQSVNGYEPHLALFANHHGLWFYEQILNQIKNHLNPSYLLVFEIGCNQSEDVVALVKQALNAEITVWKDQFNHDRVVFVRGK